MLYFIYACYRVRTEVAKFNSSTYSFGFQGLKSEISPINYT